MHSWTLLTNYSFILNLEFHGECIVLLFLKCIWKFFIMLQIHGDHSHEMPLILFVDHEQGMKMNME